MKYIIALLSFVTISSCSVEKKEKIKNEKIPCVLTSTEDKNGSTVVFTKRQCATFFNGDLDNRFNLKANGEIIPIQFDDLDGDGNWDELAFLIDLKANKDVTLTIDSKEELKFFKPSTHVRLAYSPEFSDQYDMVTEHTRPAGYVAENDKWLYQFEGIGWENDKVAFRHYFDSRNGKDIFGKKTPKLILDTIGLPRHTPEGDYHNELWWGMDVLKVGPSLGAGAIGLLQGDSLFRLGQTTSAHYQLISEGPVRALFKITYQGWNVQGADYHVTENISVWKGKYWYSNQVDISPKPEGNLVAGLVTMKTDKLPTEFYTDNYKAIVSHDLQSENKDYLGMALFASSDSSLGFGEADSVLSNISNTTFIKLTGDNKYYFMASWEGSDSNFADSTYFTNQVISEAKAELGK